MVRKIYACKLCSHLYMERDHARRCGNFCKRNGTYNFLFAKIYAVGRLDAEKSH